MKILLVEDDDVIAERVQAGLKKAGYETDIAPDGDAGLRLWKEGVYALIILDIMLPRRDGWEVCERIRARRDPVPILMLTARDAVNDRVRGLESGADDYLPKPFAFPELLARVRALLRRDKLHKARVIRVADLVIDTTARTGSRAGQSISLTPHEFDLLEALARNEGRTLTREVIMERVWNEEESDYGTVNFHIAQLRKKVDAPHPVKLIQTVHGVGYTLRSPGEEETV
ncbi:MAG: response regulator transcription factor [Armatimonadetes bacterium]|nr:response regulator transcription factor [Armatimonadota bacterium]